MSDSSGWFSCILLSAYDGPQSYDLSNPDSTTTKVQVLQVTSGHSHTDDVDTEEEDDIPTIETGKYQTTMKRLIRLCITHSVYYLKSLDRYNKIF